MVTARRAARRTLLAGFGLLILAGIVSGQVGVPFLLALATVGLAAYALPSLAEWVIEYVKPAAAAEDDRHSDPPAPHEQGAQGLGLGPSMTYDESLTWLLGQIGDPVAVTLRGRARPGPTYTDIPAVHVRGYLDHALPDPGVDQDRGEALEFVVGDHGSFSIGRADFHHAERSNDISTRGALLDFEGGMIFIVLLRKDKPAEDTAGSLDGAP